jgi:hypothetical protein
LKKLLRLLLVCLCSLPVLSRAADKKQVVPSYMSEKDANKKQPPTLDPSKFTDPQAVRAYQAAQQIPHVLAQQPCYCWCSRGEGHRGLLDCYISTHAEHCGVCQKEALLALKMHKEGKSAAEIRTAIENNAWVHAE